MEYARFAQVRAPRAVAQAFTRLWVTGTLEGLARPTVAIVGTRSASAYGRRVTRAMASALARAGCCILSGLALGIDAAAHEGALDGGGPTIGVLGGGHAQFFPRRNRGLADRMIAAGGAVLSPYEPQQRAFKSNFLARNGVVAGLADAVVVIEAPARSGALNTAGWAAGRIPVFVIPADVDRPQFAGSHLLVRDGATLVRHAGDVLEFMQLEPPAKAARRKRERVADPLQQSLLDVLTAGESPLETLVSAAHASPSQVLAALSMLELAGHVESRPGGRYGALAPLAQSD